MQRVDVDEEYVVVLVDELDGLMHLAVLVDLDETSETPHAMIYMDDIVTHLERVELRDGHLLVAFDLAVYAVAVVAVEYLMVCI